MADACSTLLRGTFERLVLETGCLGPMHGPGAAQRIERLSRGRFTVYQGSRYPALWRMKRNGWIGSEVRTAESNPSIRSSGLKAAGEQQPARERESWNRACSGGNGVLPSQGGVA